MSSQPKELAYFLHYNMSQECQTIISALSSIYDAQEQLLTVYDEVSSRVANTNKLINLGVWKSLWRMAYRGLRHIFRAKNVLTTNCVRHVASAEVNHLIDVFRAPPELRLTLPKAGKPITFSCVRRILDGPGTINMFILTNVKQRMNEEWLQTLKQTRKLFQEMHNMYLDVDVSHMPRKRMRLHEKNVRHVEKVLESS